MEIGPLFSDAKWTILKLLSKNDMSPIEISKELNTTLSNISQQLRLLEIAGLVNKIRIPNRDRGKPRKLYHLANHKSYIISLTKGFAGRKLLDLNDFHRSVLKIWFLEDKEDHYYLEKLYWNLEDNVPELKAMALDNNNSSTVYVVIDKNKEKLQKNFGSIKINKHGGNSKTFNCKFLTEEESKKVPEGAYEIHDPNSIIGKKENEVI